MRCPQCEMLSINGTPCHEIGCPNMKAVYRDGEWVRQYECGECGSKYDDKDEAASCCELDGDFPMTPDEMEVWASDETSPYAPEDYPLNEI